MPDSYYEISTGGRRFLLPARVVVNNVDRRDVEMISDEKDRPVGWLMVAYRRVPVFSFPDGLPDLNRNWTRALVIQTEGGEPVGLAVDAVQAADPGEAIAVEFSVPGNRFAGGNLFSQALLDGDRLRLVLNPERLSRYLHGLPRL